jgi:hypothetical protein
VRVVPTRDPDVAEATAIAVSVRRDASLCGGDGGRFRGPVVEGEASEAVGVEELLDVVALAGLGPVDGRELEESVLWPARCNRTGSDAWRGRSARAMIPPGRSVRAYGGFQRCGSSSSIRWAG